jgi:hypothetical protein
MVEALALLTSVVLGLFAGSLLTEALLLVPFFRSLTFAEFNRLHGEFGPRLFRYYAPLTIAAVVLPVVSAAVMSLVYPGINVFAWVAAVLSLGILAIYFLYFQGANLAFAEKRLDEGALAKELTRWAAVHNGRTVLAIGAFVASVLAT